ncbi:uncharacterized protein LOC111377563 [Olea europaea var. sylvestris]|uniref:uncharacterized protein LOC111377563 n=1 Tax=Olea europaea var. sylvestris TaxID=158386 RepID=UPI000C1D282C|nr:uncharacterized protein LOC111377563 [Olea europaea var. sylvestris]
MHGLCSYHLLKNLKSSFGGKKREKNIAEHFNRAVRAYSKTDFEFHMKQLDEINTGIRSHLKDIGYEKWSRAYMTNNRFFTMTSNIIESYINDARTTFAILVTKQEKILRENSMESKKMKVSTSSSILYQINDGCASYLVNMKERTCICNQFQVDSISCAHALAVITKIKEDSYLYSYCSVFYTTNMYIQTYSASIFPLGDHNEWNVPDEATESIKQEQYQSILEN